MKKKDAATLCNTHCALNTFKHLRYMHDRLLAELAKADETQVQHCSSVQDTLFKHLRS
jgi:hypothetical protein